MRKVRRDVTAMAPTLRPERPDDAAFLERLFAADAAAMLRAGGLPEAAVAHLVALQFRSRDATYRAHYPEARFSVVECADTRVGRLVEADVAGDTRVVDIAVDPAWRRRGVAAAILGDAMARWAAADRGGRASVLVSNGASSALFARLGFTGRARPGEAQVELTWRARSSDRPDASPDPGRGNAHRP